MCAITGLISRGSYFEEGHEIYGMADLMFHRGPDAQGFASYGDNLIRPLRKGDQVPPSKALLGFDRLSIRDISINGMQPMISGDGKVAIVFNGEIYNTNEMMRSIGDYPYFSSSDTEVLMAYYLKFGIEDCIRKLNGMFAICILDSRLNKAFLVRDRMGIKPLYYTTLGNGDLAFASEVKAFLANRTFNPELNLDALHEFFTFGEPVGQLLLKNVKEATPGSILSIDLMSLNIQEVIYFDINSLFHNETEKFNISEITELYAHTLRRAVKRQLISDVPVGVQCSGGVDSSLVAYTVGCVSSENFNGGVSIIPADTEFSEEQYIDVIAEKSGIQIRKFPLDDEFVVRNIEKAVWHYESIITYHNVVALLKLSEMSKPYMSVLMSGEGADELFAGYTWFEDGFFASKVLSMKQRLYQSNAFDKIEDSVRGLKGAQTFGDFVISCTDNISEDVAGAILSPVGYERNKIYRKRICYFDSFDGDDFDKHIKYEISVRLRSLLIRQDKTSMANSIENRVPFLDNEMIELAFHTPKTILIKNMRSSEDMNDPRTYHSLKGKYPLKRLCRDLYGEKFAFRRKMGFPLPFHKYMNRADFQDYVFEDVIPGMKDRGIMDDNYVKNNLLTMDCTKNRWTYAGLWKAITFEIFCRQFIDKQGFDKRRAI